MYRPLILLLFLVAPPLGAQETDDVDSEQAQAEQEEAADTSEDVAEEALEDDEFSDELYTEEEDAFIPSENVKFGQSIPFPTDI